MNWSDRYFVLAAAHLPMVWLSGSIGKSVIAFTLLSVCIVISEYLEKHPNA